MADFWYGTGKISLGHFVPGCQEAIRLLGSCSNDWGTNRKGPPLAKDRTVLSIKRKMASIDYNTENIKKSISSDT